MRIKKTNKLRFLLMTIIRLMINHKKRELSSKPNQIMHKISRKMKTEGKMNLSFQESKRCS